MEEDGKNRAAQQLVSVRWKRTTREQRERLGRLLTAARLGGSIGRYSLDCSRCIAPSLSEDGDDFVMVLEDARLHAKVLEHDGSLTITDRRATPGQPQIFRIEGGRAYVDGVAERPMRASQAVES